jgi:hypothetical protein
VCAYQARSSSVSIDGERTVISSEAAVVQIVECVRHAAELTVGRSRGGLRVQSVHGSSATQVVRVQQARSSGSSIGASDQWWSCRRADS